MLSRPGDPAYFAGLLDDLPEPPDIFHGIPAPEPIEGWGPDEQWANIVGRPMPNVVPVPRIEPVQRPGGLTIEQLGPATWKVRIGIGEFLFRDVATHRGMEADVSVSTGDIHLFRSTATLSLTGRRTIAKGAIERAVGVGTEADWTRATDLAVEAVMEAAEALGAGVDLREGEVTDIGPQWVCDPLWTTGATMIVMPGEAGKSTLARAMATSIVTGRMIVPGLYPRMTGPVLYVASEDPGADSHKRSIDAICRGAGLDRRSLNHEIRLLASQGKPLHRLARNIAERSKDYAGIILDAMQGLLPGGESGVRDQAAMFWGAIDEIGKPVFVVAHPNLSQARSWKSEADGRAAGSEVSRDRARLSWMGRRTDEPTVDGAYNTVFDMECTKWNDGPKESLRLTFRRTWTSGVVTFTPADAPVSKSDSSGLADHISEILAKNPLRARELSDRLGVSQQTINTTCGRKPERFFRTPTGDWSLVGWTLP